ncbi:MAG TPA: hypothetical protein PKJ08_08010, partial [Candidatus Cloacimonadota bacterium]|nr:hypothetical protein [Candidatus Cloacimonadota bacterium]
QLVDGVLNYHSADSTLTWTLNTAIPANNEENGNYYVLYSAIDIAGNSSNGRIDFNLQNIDFVTGPVLVNTYPSLNQNINQLNSNQIRTVILSDFPINQADSYVKLTHSVTGVCIENNQGALLSYQTQGNQTTITLTLNQGLLTDGADDATYYVEYYVENTLNQSIAGSVLFNYDTTHPTIASLKINQSSLQTVNQINYYANRIDSVSVYLNDNLSGIDFAANMSRIQLYNQNDQVINGLRTIDVNTRRITWKLNSPILLEDANSGMYTIKVVAYDKAANNFNQNTAFQLINPSQPQIVEHIPVTNAVINQLVSNRISKKILDVNTFGLDRQNSQIILQGPLSAYQNGNGANLSFTSLQNNLWQANLTLTNSLATNGSADGNYTVQTTIVDTIGQSVSHQMNFIYDTQAPVVSNELIGGTQDTTPWNSNLSNNMIVNQNIQYVSINLNDVTTQVNYSSSSTYLGIYNAQNQLLPGVQTLNGSTLRYLLNNQLLSDGSMDGTYYAKYSATDIAGNTITGQKNFRLINPSAPQINNIVPAHGSVFNMLANNEIYVEFTDIRPIDLQDYENSYIKVTTPNNTVIEHNQGATQQIISTGENSYRMRLILNQSLSLNGLYTLQTKVQNTQSYNTQFITQFIFDNQAPQIQSVRLGLQNGSETIVSNNDNIYHGVAYVKLLLADQTAGVDYLSDETAISVSVNNQAVPGTLFKYPDENYLKYVFNETLSELGSIVAVQSSAVDNADNTVISQLSFVLNALQANIVSVTPANNAFINTNLNQIKLVVEYEQNVVMNENLTYLRLKHPDGSFIEDGQGANLEISNNENQYEITLTLNQALGTNGQDDGQYQIYALLATDNFQEGPITFNFVYDRLTPYYQNLKINDMIVNRQEKFLKENMPKRNQKNDLIFSQPITHIQVNYYDLTSQVNFASNLTNISLLSPGGSLVQGTRIVDNATVKWVLSSPIPVDGTQDGTYSIQMKATDYSGNILTGNYSFTLMSHIVPQLVDYTPQNVINYYTNSFTPPTITGSFKNTIPVVQNPLYTYIKLTFPNGEIAEHSQGANLSYQLEQTNLKTTLQLTGPLSADGENDGQFYVNFHATNQYGAEFDTTMTFIYDTIMPSYTQLALYNGSTQSAVAENSIVSQPFNSVQVKLTDMTSGVHYSPNISYVSLYDLNNNLIPGTLSYVDNGSDVITRWTFLNPDAVPLNGLADGIYKIKMKVTDKAGNSISKEIPFNVISIIAPQNLVTYLDAVYKVHISWNNPNPVKKEIKSRAVSYYQVFRKYNDEAYVQIAQTSNLYYSDNLQQQN